MRTFWNLVLVAGGVAIGDQLRAGDVFDAGMIALAVCFFLWSDWADRKPIGGGK